MEIMRSKKSKDYIAVMAAARMTICRDFSIMESFVEKWPISKICKKLGLRFADGTTPKGTRELKRALHQWERTRTKIVVLPVDHRYGFSPPAPKKHTDKADRQLLISAAAQAADLAKKRDRALHRWVNSPEFLASKEWQQLRSQAFKLWGKTCQKCGAEESGGAIICGEHIKPRKLFPHLALELSNIQVLCSSCNREKGNWDHTDWRPTPEQFEEAAERAFQEMMGLARSAYGATYLP